MKLAASIKVLLLIIAFSFASACAWADDNAKADAILNKLEDGSVVNNTHIQAYIDEAEALIKPTDQARSMRLIKAKCWVHDFTQTEDVNKAIDFARHWLAQEKIEKFPVTKVDLILCESWFQEHKGLHENAKKGYEKALQLALSIENERLAADAYSLLGELLSFQGNFTAALTNLIKAQELYQSLNTPYWQLYNLTAIAVSYRRFGDPERAIYYFKKIIKIYRSQNDEDQIAFIRRDIAFALEELGRYPEAIKYHRQNYQYYRNRKEDLDQAIAATELAGALIQVDKIKEARAYLQEAKPHIKPDTANTYSHFYLYLAQILFAEQKLIQALEYVEVAISGFKKKKNNRYFQFSLLLKADIHAALENWSLAYQTQQAFIKTHQELDKQQLSQQTTEMRYKFDLDQIETENKQLLEYKRLKENEKLILEQNKQLQVMVLFLAVIIIFYLAYSVYKQRQKTKVLETLALTDHLTQLPNRRHMYKWGNKAFQQARNSHNPLSIILFDADHFKKINDELGHEEGDKTLKKLAQLSASLMRKQDKVGRIGGEEFLVILRSTPKEQALAIAQRLVDSVETELEQHLHCDNKLTISAGVAYLEENNSQDNFNALVNRADKALYDAKSAGRNCARLS